MTKKRKDKTRMSKSRLVLLDVPERRWWKFPLKGLGFSLLVGSLFALLAYEIAAWKFADGLPAFPTVDEYRPPILSQMYTADGVLAAEFYKERRKVVPYEQIPKRLVQAFIAAEDADFFDHFGIDILGSMRAVAKTITLQLTGKGRLQGGSTLTQQTAKSILISAEGYKTATAKTLTRKIREALLARRLERKLSKEEILYLYLNNVYLGHHSYGVQSAAENYFRKDVKELSLAEMALIAGLPQAPSSFSPFRNPKAAKKRRQYVLGQLLNKGMITQAEYVEASSAAISAYPVEDVFHEFAPYFSEHVRQYVVARLGNTALLNEGLQIFTTMDSEKQRAAHQAVLDGLLEVDKRQGFRGPVTHLSDENAKRAFAEKSRKVMQSNAVLADQYYVGVVAGFSKDKLVATIDIGGHTAKLPALGMRWARPVNAERYYPSELIDTVSPPLRIGDVVVVRGVKDVKALVDDKVAWSDALAKKVPTAGPLVRLEQEPEAQAALVSIDPEQQYLVAMVGGYDFDANEYNRVFQACRQPGSNFKPIVYAGAIELMGWTQGTLLVDSPIVYDDPAHRSRWKPSNYGRNFQGEVLLHTALVNSMNVPAVKTFIELARFLGNRNEVVGIKKIAAFVQKLGISSPLNLDYSAALGSSCVYPFELAQVYATVQRLGVKKPTYFVRKIEDRFGRTIEDRTAYDDPWASLKDRIAAGYARLYEPGEHVLSPESAFILMDLLRNVVQTGTGIAASRLGKPAAGKTGTTNDSFDAWFTGFTRNLLASAWVGYDLNPHPLGKYETGSRAALPIWLSYMQKALKGRRQPELTPPAHLDMVRRNVDRRTGRLASSPKGSVALWFQRGTEPVDREPEKGVMQASDFLQVQ